MAPCTSAPSPWCAPSSTRTRAGRTCSASPRTRGLLPYEAGGHHHDAADDERGARRDHRRLPLESVGDRRGVAVRAHARQATDLELGVTKVARRTVEARNGIGVLPEETAEPFAQHHEEHDP